MPETLTLPHPPDLRAVTRSRALAQQVHHGQQDRTGKPMIDHVERVVLGVPPFARSVAYVHDVCERSALTPADVAARVGLSDAERSALELLTSDETESLEDHVARVRRARPGLARRMAMVVKRSDVADHVAHGAGTARSRYVAALRSLHDA